MITKARKFFNRIYDLENSLENIKTNYKDWRGELATEIVREMAGFYIGTVKVIKSEAKVLNYSNNPWIYSSERIEKTFTFGKDLSEIKQFIKLHKVK